MTFRSYEEQEQYDKGYNAVIEVEALAATQDALIRKVLNAWLIQNYPDLAKSERAQAVERLAQFRDATLANGAPNAATLNAAMPGILKIVINDGEIQLMQDHGRVAAVLRGIHAIPLTEAQIHSLATRICREVNLYPTGTFSPGHIELAVWRMKSDPASAHLFVRPAKEDGTQRTKEDDERDRFHGHTEKEWSALSGSAQLKAINNDRVKEAMEKRQGRSATMAEVDKLAADTMPDYAKGNPAKELAHWEYCAGALRADKSKAE